MKTKQSANSDVPPKRNTLGIANYSKSFIHIPVWVGFVIRLVIAYSRPTWTSYLGGRVEIVTPITRFKRCRNPNFMSISKFVL